MASRPRDCRSLGHHRGRAAPCRQLSEEKADPNLVKDQETRNEALKKVSVALHLPEEKVSKDLDLYRSNLEKMAQARIVLEDVIQAERKKREQRVTKASSSADASESSN